MNDLVIRNCHALLFDGPAQPVVRPGQDILIRGNRIAAVQPSTPDAPPARESVEGYGMLAIPGLINTHAHVPMVLFRCIVEDVPLHRWFNEFIWPLESNLTPDDVYWGMLLGLAESIEAGVTTVADHYFFMDDAARAVEEAGTRAALGWAVFSSQGPEALARTADFVARRQGTAGGRITAWMAPHAPYTCDDDTLRAASRYARELGTGIHIHAAEDMNQTRSSLAKRSATPIQVLEETGVLDVPAIIAHGCGILPEDIERLRPYAAHVGVAHTPKTYMKLAAGLTPIAGLRAAGVAVGLCTDGAVSNNTLDVLENLRLMGLTQKFAANDAEVMHLGEALDIAFRGSARVLSMGDRLGELAPGFLADIALIDLGGVHLQPLHNVLAALVYAARASDVDTVIVDGRVLMRGRELITLDKTEILRQVGKSMQRLSQRVPGRTIQVYAP